MGIQSLGVGSGLALDDLVTQLIEAERKPKEERLNQKEESLDAIISGIGSLQSKLSDFEDSVDELRNDYNLNARKPQIDHPSSLNLGEGDDGPFTAEASTSALEASYDVVITGLAKGTRYESTDGDFANTSSSVLSAGSGSISFKFGTSTDTFSVNVSAGMSLQQLANSINSSANNLQSDGLTPLVTASIIDTGTAAGAKLVYNSTLTGANDNLIVVNDNDLADLDRVTSTDSTETIDRNLNTNGLKTSAANATATIDGIAVQSSTNKFENVIQNVSFEATTLSPDANNDGTPDTASKLTIGNDKDGMKSKIRDFVDDYNTLMDEIGRLTKYGQSELEDDGALAGDFMVRGLQTQLANIISNKVPASALGTLFSIGVGFTDKGKLEISAIDEFGLGSGEDRMKTALEENFDEVAKLFTDSNDGIAKNLYDYIREFTKYGGLLRTREQNYKDEKNNLEDERARFELQMMNFEQIQRDKYLNLDQTVSQLNRTGNALMASLGY